LTIEKFKDTYAMYSLDLYMGFVKRTIILLVVITLVILPNESRSQFSAGFTAGWNLGGISNYHLKSIPSNFNWYMGVATFYEADEKIRLVNTIRYSRKGMQSKDKSEVLKRHYLDLTLDAQGDFAKDKENSKFFFSGGLYGSFKMFESYKLNSSSAEFDSNLKNHDFGFSAGLGVKLGEKSDSGGGLLGIKYVQSLINLNNESSPRQIYRGVELYLIVGI